MRSRPIPTWRSSTCSPASVPASTSSPAANWPACWPPAATPEKSCSPASARPRRKCAQALEAGILCFNVESVSELHRLNRVAGELGKVAPVSFRVNPDVDPKTHPYISTGLKENKFGVPIADAPALYRRAAAPAEPENHRRRLPHRLAADRPVAAGRCRRSRARAGRRAGGRGHRAAAHRPRRRRRHPLPRRDAARPRRLRRACWQRALPAAARS